MELLKILLLEDNPHDAALVERELRRGGVSFELSRASNRPSFVEALANHPDLVISDYSLPGFDGLSAFALLRQQHPDAPFILVSGEIGDELAVAAIRQGVTDYLLKDRLQRLPTAVRTALDQQRLRREKEELERRLLRADRLESLGQLAAGVAHDLNNILTPIMMAAEVLPDGITDPDDLALLSTIRTCAERGAKVLRQLLAFGRGTSGDKVRVRLGSSVAETASLVSETFPRGVRLALDVAAPDAEVFADPTQIQQILLNLCVNARDAMGESGTLTLGVGVHEVDPATTRAHPGSQPGPHAVLWVRDTGSGITPADIERIFDPFFTTKPVDQGTGLGLSSVLGIVKGHGGFIQVDSALGEGSEFRVYLPLRQTGAPQPGPDKASTERRGPGGMVLVVDDEPQVRGVVRRGLTRYGYRVLEAVDGATGFEQYTANALDIGAVVMDLSMPGVDGISLVRRLREGGANVPVIAIMGLASTEQVRELRELGVQHLLQKPFGIGELLKHLAVHFSEPGAAPPA